MISSRLKFTYVMNNFFFESENSDRIPNFPQARNYNGHGFFNWSSDF